MIAPVGGRPNLPRHSHPRHSQSFASPRVVSRVACVPLRALSHAPIHVECGRSLLAERRRNPCLGWTAHPGGCFACASEEGRPDCPPRRPRSPDVSFGRWRNGAAQAVDVHDAHDAKARCGWISADPELGAVVFSVRPTRPARHTQGDASNRCVEAITQDAHAGREAADARAATNARKCSSC
jgi:hypothetical protein